MAQREIVKLSEYPSNSFSSKEQAEEKKEKKKKVERIVETKVTKRKQTVGSRLAETFCGDDTANVKDYILYDVLIPAAKSTLSDIVTGGIEMLLYGERRSGSNRTSRDRGRSYVSYRSFYEDDRHEPSRVRRRRKRQFEDIVLEKRSDAEEVLSALVDLVDNFDRATVGDLYEMIGEESNYTDEKWGWDNLHAAYVERCREGYLLRLPKPILLD